MSIPRNLSIIADTLNADGTFFTITDSGNLTFTGTGNRITGDFSNATVASRVAFQTSTANNSTTIMALPNGSGTNSQLLLRSGSTAADDSFGQVVLAGGSDFRIASGAVGTGTNLPMTFYTGGSERVRIDTSGNVGIGTSSPSQRLQVGDGTADTRASFRPNTAFAVGIANGAGFAGWIGGSGTTDVMVFSSSGGTERMRIDASGNVGIGTSAPTGKLDVRTVAGTSAVMNLSSGSNATQTKFTISQVASIDWDVGISASAGDFYIGGLGGSVAEAYRITRNGTSIDNHTWNTGGAARMRIDSSGNVGIGNSSPTVKLDVTGGIKVSGQLMAGTSGSIFSPLVSAGYVAGTSNIYIRNISGTNRIDSYNDPITATYPFQINASQIAFYIADVEKMRIDSSGNVGIGTTSPGSYGRFVVVSSGDYIPAATFISNSSAVNWARADWDNVNVAYNGIIYQDNSGVFNIRNDGANAIAFLTNGGTERMRIDSSGNVGIGTSSSAARLGVVNDQAALSYLFDTSNATNGGSSLWRMITRNIANTGTTSVDFYKPSGTGFSIINNDTNASNFTAFNVGSSERMRIDNSGNVLVTNPAGLGYGTGSGGTVTQATSKSTGVTLNKPTGQITMNNAALLAATTVQFNLSNSLLAATDTLIVNVNLSGVATAGAYSVRPCISAGIAQITLVNEIGSSLSEAVILNFAIIKGATS